MGDFVSLNELFIPQSAGGGGEEILNSMVGYMTECTQSTDSSGSQQISIKWSNGLWIWVKNYSEATHACTEAHGNIYYKDFTGWYFPPMTQVYGITMHQTSGNGTHWFQVSSWSGTDKKYSFRLCNGTNTQLSFSFCTIAIGTWK